MYKRADELVRGDVVRMDRLRRKILKVEKLRNPGKKTELIHVRVEFTKHATHPEIAVFPPSEIVEVGLDGNE